MAVELTSALRERRRYSKIRLDSVRQRLAGTDAGDVLANAGVVYATGSMARGDASQHSDLDVFILSHTDGEHRALSKLDSIRLKAKLIEVVEAEALPKFSDDGKYLVVHTIDEMLGKLGTAEDDYENLFTARMLLLLESAPLLGDEAYAEALRRVIDKYWVDFARNESEFLPVFLTNDIIRYWKVLCLNYEAYTWKEPEQKRRHQNYKLKFSRLLTCYSAVVDLLTIVRTTGRVTPDDAMAMARRMPMDRLLAVSSALSDEAADASIQKLLSMYESFLATTGSDKDELRALFKQDDYNSLRRAEAKAFGDEMFTLLKLAGSETKLYRYLVI